LFSSSAPRLSNQIVLRFSEFMSASVVDSEAFWASTRQKLCLRHISIFVSLPGAGKSISEQS
jgi:hypothetical protein